MKTRTLTAETNVSVTGFTDCAVKGEYPVYE